MVSGDVDATLAALRSAAQALTSPTTSLADEVRALAVARNALDAALTDSLAEMEQTRGFEAEDASSLPTWAAREVRMDPAETRARVRASHALRDLPSVRTAFAGGRVSFEHARLFAYSTRHVGHQETRDLESVLLDLAAVAEPSVLRQAVRYAKAVIHPDSLDEAWIRGMERRDLTLAKLEDGWHVNGFLPIDVGAKLATVLTSLSVPRGADESRSAAQRRVDGLDTLLTRVLADGLPTDGTVTPQLHVIVEAEPADPGEPAAPAVLTGFGPIGPRLLEQIACGATMTPYRVEVVEGRRHLIDVGKAQRLATRKQRQAIWLTQGGICHRSHCRNPIDHLHHVTPWSRGGPTAVDNLVGLCHACHTHTHARDGTKRRAA